MSREDQFHVLQGRSAGFVTRMLALLVDLAFVAVILAVGGWLSVLVDLLLQQLGIHPRISASAIYLYLTPFIIGSYFVVMWALAGRTVGKWFMGLKIVAADGHPPRIGQSILRFVGYAVSALGLWIGFVWVIIDDERQGWHDHIATTWVVYDYERRKGGEIYNAFLERQNS